jgi:tetratricopeptide (TPR) repeat protein
MKKSLVSLAVLAALSCQSLTQPPASAQRAMAYALYKSGVAAYEKGDYKEALRAEQQCADMLATTKHTAVEEANILYSLGETQRCLGKFKESEATLKKSMALNDNLPKALRIDNWLFNSMAALYLAQGKFPEAETLWKMDLEYLRKGAVQRFWPVNNLITLYILWGKPDEAESYLKEALSLAKKFPKTQGMQYALLNQGQLEEQFGDYKEAEAYNDEAFEKSVEICGPNHPYGAVILVKQAELYRKQSRYAEAEKTLGKALEILQSHYTSDHPDICETQVKLARVLYEDGKYQQARELVKTALKNEEALFGDPNNLFIAHAKECLGNTYRQDGHYDEAQKMLEEVLAIEHTMMGTANVDTAITMRNLALVQADQANFKEAENLLQDSIKMIEEQTGPVHPERAAAASALAHVYLRDDKFQEAEPLLKKSLELSEKVLGANNSVTANGARDLGELYVKQKQFELAATYQQKALTIDETLYGVKAPQIAADLTALASTYGALGQTDKAAPLLTRAAEIKNVLPGGNTKVELQPQQLSKESDRPVHDKWALVIGISNFKDSSINLKYAAKDATDFKNFLVTTEKFKPDHVKLLTDESASRDNIIGMLGDKWLANRVKPDDLVIVYVSSHGSSATTEAGGTNFLVAYDTNKNSLLATGIPMQWLTSIVSDQVQSDRIILIMDVCHSGAVGEGQKALTRTVGLDPNVMKIGKGQMILCSSLAEQVSWESKGYENSVFTRRLMEALQTDKDKTTMMEAYKRLKVMVESEVLQDRGNLQTPLLVNKNWIGSDPALAVEPIVK